MNSDHIFSHSLFFHSMLLFLRLSMWYIFQLYGVCLLFLLFKLRNKRVLQASFFIREWRCCQYHILFVGDILKLICRLVRHGLLLLILFSMKPPRSLKFLLIVSLQFFLLLVYTPPLFCHSCKHGYVSRNYQPGFPTR